MTDSDDGRKRFLVGERIAAREIVAIARAILAEELPWLDGFRRIDALSVAFSEGHAAPFESVSTFVSETDYCVAQDAKALWAPEYVARTDEGLARYIELSRPWLEQACRELIAALDEAAP